MYDRDIQAPYITQAERDGREYSDVPRCPECGCECETVMIDRYGEIAGCENCIILRDATECAKCFERSKR